MTCTRRFNSSSSMWFLAIPLSLIPIGWSIVWNLPGDSLEAQSTFSYKFLEWFEYLYLVVINLMIYTCIKKKWNPLGIAICFVVAAGLEHQNLLGKGLHLLFLKWDVYAWWSFLSTHPTANENIAKMALAVGVWALFLLTHLIKKRTIEYYLIGMSALAIFTGSILLHWTFVEREYHQTLFREKEWLGHMVFLKQKSFEEWCKSDTWVCVTSSQTLIRQSPPNLDQVPSEPLKREFLKAIQENACHPIQCEGGSVKGSGLPSMPYAIGKTEEGDYHLIVDTGSRATKHFYELRMRFSILAILLSSVWVYGSIILWSRHQKRVSLQKPKN